MCISKKKKQMWITHSDVVHKKLMLQIDDSKILPVYNCGSIVPE